MILHTRQQDTTSHDDRKTMFIKQHSHTSTHNSSSTCFVLHQAPTDNTCDIHKCMLLHYLHMTLVSKFSQLAQEWLCKQDILKRCPSCQALTVIHTEKNGKCDTLMMLISSIPCQNQGSQDHSQRLQGSQVSSHLWGGRCKGCREASPGGLS